MIDASGFQFLFFAIIGWLDRWEREALAYLIEENRVLRRQPAGERPAVRTNILHLQGRVLASSADWADDCTVPAT